MLEDVGVEIAWMKDDHGGAALFDLFCHTADKIGRVVVFGRKYVLAAHAHLCRAAEDLGGGVEGSLLLAQAMGARHIGDGAVQGFRHHGVGLEVVWLMPHKRTEALMLGFDLADRLVVVDEIYAVLEALAIGAAALELAASVHKAGDRGRICAGRAEVDVGVLADRDILSFEPGEAALRFGHVGHEADRADESFLDGMDERWVDECGLGPHDEEKAEMRSGRRATVYLWHAENVTADVVFRVVCTDGKVCEATKESRDRNYWLPGQELPDRYADGSLRSEQESPACSFPESPELTFNFGEGTGAGSSLSPQDFDSAQGYADAVAASGGSWDDAYTRWEDECGDG